MTQVEVLSMSRTVGRTRWADTVVEQGHREIPEEAPVALVHDATTTAVMMATPADVEDLAIGFSLTEGVIGGLGDIRSIEVIETALGLEARMWLTAPRTAALAARRRHFVGPTGCGLCGVDSLTEASRSPRQVGRGFTMRPDQVHASLDLLGPAQALGSATRAVHAAAWWTPQSGLVAVREDVGRHNALDKLVGALAGARTTADGGALVLTSRVSVEMVQKAANFGAQVIIAVSAPTALAVRTAAAAGLTLIAVARRDSFEVFAHPERIVG